MKVIFFIIFSLLYLYGFSLKSSRCIDRSGFDGYLKKHDIPKRVLQNMPDEDRKFLSDISLGYECYELYDRSDNLAESLVPINEQMQIHLYRSLSKRYKIEIIPISYKPALRYFDTIIVNGSLSSTLKAYKNEGLKRSLKQAFKDLPDSYIPKDGDRVDVEYLQKSRFGRAFGDAKIEMVRVVHDGAESFIYVDDKGNGYTSDRPVVTKRVSKRKKIVKTETKMVNVSGGSFGMPLAKIRVTSSFSYRRWHPILHRYRPHHGTDFGASFGTPLYAVNSGVVSYAGWMRGYGRVVKIRHKGGYESLYAHQSRIRVKLGQRVKKGQIIGYVGSSGRSTGPHLHFGLMKNGRWIDPMTVLRRSKASRKIVKKYTTYKNVVQIKKESIKIRDAKEKKDALLRYVNLGEKRRPMKSKNALRVSLDEAIKQKMEVLGEDR